MKHFVAIAGFSLLYSLALGQGSTQKDIWSPHAHIKDQNITLIPWGSGAISETSETAFDGAFSLRVSTHNYFQGGLLKFNTPVDVASHALDANNLLQLSFR